MWLKISAHLKTLMSLNLSQDSFQTAWLYVETVELSISSLETIFFIFMFHKENVYWYLLQRFDNLFNNLSTTL